MSNSSAPVPPCGRDPKCPEPADVAELAERVAGIEMALRDGHRRAAHRETQIDRLHEENQRLRVGLNRQLLEPVVSDLARLYDGLTREGSRLRTDPATAGAGALLTSFADDVELALDRCGVDVVAPVVGEAFQPGHHAAVGVEPCDSAALDGTVAATVGIGLRDHETGTLRRLPKARFFRLAAPVETPVGGEEADEGSTAGGREDL